MKPLDVLDIFALLLVGFVISFFLIANFAMLLSEPSNSIPEGSDIPSAFDARPSAKHSSLPSSFELVEMNISAYCPCEKCCGRFADGITASGHRIQPGDKFVAAPLNIPFGTLLAVPGYAEGLPVPVLDRGGAIKGNKLDVYMDTHQEALNWGRQYLKVKIVEEQK